MQEIAGAKITRKLNPGLVYLAQRFQKLCIRSTYHCILFAKIDWFWGQLNKTIPSVITRLEIISGESLDMRSSQIHFSLVTYHFWVDKLIT